MNTLPVFGASEGVTYSFGGGLLTEIKARETSGQRINRSSYDVSLAAALGSDGY